MSTFFLQTIVDGIAGGAVLALLAVGLSVTFRLSKFVNIAHGDIATTGAYASFLILGVASLDFITATLAGVVIAALVGYLSYLIVFRRLRNERPITLIITSVGVAFIVRYVIVFIWGSNQQSYDLPLMRAIRFAGLRINPYDLVIFIVCMLTFAILFVIIRYTSHGRAMRAVADNPQLARVAGLSTEAVLARIWLVASALSGLAGILLAAKTVITPYLGWYMLLPAFAAMIFGGIGSIGGTLIAGLILGVVSELAAAYWLPTYRVAAIFGVIVLVLMVRPQGLLGIKTVAR